MKSFGPKAWMLPQPVLIIGTYNKDGKPDVEKMGLITFDPCHFGYIALGEKVGNALFYHTSEGKRIYDLPDDVVWPGTLVLAEIPVEEKEFNIYNYIG